jgi:hypothetical protein
MCSSIFLNYRNYDITLPDSPFIRFTTNKTNKETLQIRSKENANHNNDGICHAKAIDALRSLRIETFQRIG